MSGGNPAVKYNAVETVQAEYRKRYYDWANKHGYRPAGGRLSLRRLFGLKAIHGVCTWGYLDRSITLPDLPPYNDHSRLWIDKNGKAAAFTSEPYIGPHARPVILDFAYAHNLDVEIGDEVSPHNPGECTMVVYRVAKKVSK